MTKNQNLEEKLKQLKKEKAEEKKFALKTLNSLIFSVEHWQQETKKLREEKIELERKIEEYKKNLTDKEKELQEKVESLEKERDELDKKISDLEKKQQDYEKEIARLENELKKPQNDEEKKNLQDKLNQVKNDLQKVRSDLETSQERREELRKEIRELQADFSKQRDELRDRINRLNDELDKLTKENIRLSQELNKVKDKNEQLERENEKLKENSGDKGNKEEVEKLKKEVKDLTEQLLGIMRSKLYRQITITNRILKISANLLNNKYRVEGKKYTDIINEELTLKNLPLLEETLGVVMGICSIERYQAFSDDLDNQEELDLISVKALQENLELLNNHWQNLGTNINKENNPMYLEIVAGQQVQRDQTKALIEKWKQVVLSRANKRGMDDLTNSKTTAIKNSFVKLEVSEGNYCCSTSPKWKNKPLCERYGFTYQDEWIQIDIPHDLLAKLGLKEGEDITQLLYIDPQVLKREKTFGGITIEREEEIILVDVNSNMTEEKAFFDEEKNEWRIEGTKRYQKLIETGTIFGVSKNATPQSVADYFAWLKEKWPNITIKDDRGKEVDGIEHRYQAIKPQLEEAFKNSSYQEVEEQLQRALLGDKLIEAFKKATNEQIKNLLETNDSWGFSTVSQDLVKKLVSRIKTNANYGADDIAFIISGLYGEIFLDYLPKKVKKYCEQDPKVELSELQKNADWNNKVGELFEAMYSKLKDVDEQGLKPVQEDINITYEKLVKIIDEMKDSKKEEDTQLCRDPNHSDTPAQAQAKVKKHLEEVEQRWKEWKNSSEDSKESAVLLFRKWDKDGKMSDEILSLIDKALRTGELADTLEGYKLLNKEWGENNIEEGKVKYNADRDYLGAWNTFRILLGEWEKTNEVSLKIKAYEKLKRELFRLVGREHSKELLAQIEINN